MNQTPEKPNQLSPEMCYEDDEINLIDLIYPIYNRRKFLIKFCLIITLLTAIISLFSEKIYEAKTVILPEAEDKGGSGFELKAAFLEQFGVSGLGGASATSSDVFEAVLKSNELAMEVLTRYDYFMMIGKKKADKLKIVKSIAGKINVATNKKDPTITVSMQYPDPIFVADIANSYVKALDNYNLTNSYTSARRLKEYIENRLRVADEELDVAQKELREFQEKNRAISISKQTEATLEVLAEMESQRVALEVAKAAKERFYKGPHIELEQLDAQIAAINKNISRLTNSQEASVPIELENGKVEFYIPLTRIPALNYDESKLLLKVKAKTGVITMLTTQLEQAKLDEAKDMPTINTLEVAEPPQKSVKPKIKLNVILGFVVSLFLGIFVIFFMEFTQRLDNDPESAPKWKEIKQGLNRMIPFRRGYR
jgi:uncharacterized protein involved in exopolysaccharide biosynthesis